MRELEPKMRELVVCVREERAQAGEGEGEGEERARAGEARARAEVCVRERERESTGFASEIERERELGDVRDQERERELGDLGDVGARRCVMEFMLLRRAQPRVLHLHREIKARFHSSFSNHCASVEPQILHCRAPSSPESSLTIGIENYNFSPMEKAKHQFSEGDDLNIDAFQDMDIAGSGIWGSDYHDMRMDCDNQEDDLLGEDLEAMEKEDLAPVILFKINI
ncbi:unnamed protein product [Brassica rapa]|uniref:BnaA02g19600D protein n=2 Tax=Brassica TaxID=3705 RepID=A0A078HH13_BRANA|nr:unnamed protein product [Brassica rapa]CDY37610.1 BnaA02g19600D [Brassica napus]VDC89462.1 unnamed protein product [Brassica rapa]